VVFVVEGQRAPEPQDVVDQKAGDEVFSVVGEVAVVEANDAFKKRGVELGVVHGLALEEQQHPRGEGVRGVVVRAAEHPLHLADVQHLQVPAVTGERREPHRLGRVDEACREARERDPREAVGVFVAVVQEEQIDVGSTPPFKPTVRAGRVDADRLAGKQRTYRTKTLAERGETVKRVLSSGRHEASSIRSDSEAEQPRRRPTRSRTWQR
jgi:hypothetical protein